MLYSHMKDIVVKTNYLNSDLGLRDMATDATLNTRCNQALRWLAQKNLLNFKGRLC